MRNLLRELADSTQGLRDELRAHLYALEHSETGQKPTGFPENQPYTLPDDFEFQAYFDRVGEIRDEIQDYTIPWIREADQRLATSTRLPEDDGDWPSWLGTASLPSDIIRFWQTVPLAPGAKGTNNPPKRQ